jgi:hypothetical protein
MHRISICACARWEEQYITEWIEYHLSVGFDHFYIYSNNDNYATLAEVLLPYIARPNPIVTYIHCPEIGGAQMKMYNHYVHNYSKESEWTCIIDIDEFVALPGYEMNVNNMVAELGLNHDSIQLNWLCFGPNGYETRPAGGVLTKYTKCSLDLDKHTKFLAKNQFLSTPFFHIHSAHPQVKTCDVLGNSINSVLWMCMGQESTYLNYLNQYKGNLKSAGFIAHYMHKSHLDAERRLARGAAHDIYTDTYHSPYKQYVDDPSRKAAFFAQSEQTDYNYLKEYWENYIIKKLLPDDKRYLDIESAKNYLQFEKWQQGF